MSKSTTRKSSLASSPISNRHAAHRPPERASARVLRLEGRLAGRDGDAAPAIGPLDPVGNQRLNESNELGDRPLAGRILRIRVAEKIDCLHVRRIRVHFGLEGIARSEGIGGDRMDLRIVEPGYPRPRQAGGLAPSPSADPAVASRPARPHIAPEPAAASPAGRLEARSSPRRVLLPCPLRGKRGPGRRRPPSPARTANRPA